MRQFFILLLCLTAVACAPFKQNKADSARKKFSPLLYEYGESIPAQWDGKDWNPTAWPISYQNKEKFTQNLFDADIIRKQYIKGDQVPVVVVGPNFYHLSDLDQKRVCDTLNQLYGATTGQYGHFVLTDWYSRKIIGEYTKAGLVLR